MCREDVHCKLLTFDAVNKVWRYPTKDDCSNVQDDHISYVQILLNVLIYVDCWSLDDHKDYRDDSENKIVEEEYFTDIAYAHLDCASSVHEQKCDDVAC